MRTSVFNLIQNIHDADFHPDHGGGLHKLAKDGVFRSCSVVFTIWHGFGII